MGVVLALSEFEAATLTRLKRRLDADLPGLLELDAYYEGVQRLEQLGLAVPPELRNFVTIVNWPRVAVDAVEERINLEGFRLPGEEDRDDDLWRVWQSNGLDEESQLAHLDALVFGRSFVCVGANDEDPSTPLITVESPLELVAERDPRTRRVSAALRMYRGDGSSVGSTEAEFATLYLPNETVWLERGPGKVWVESGDRDVHGMGFVPVVPLVNRTRTTRRTGVSEIADVISLTDAAARALTNAQIATEVLAVPQRYVLGAKPEEFQDPQGNYATKWETYFSSVWLLTNDKAQVGQFAAADLANFTKIVDHYAAQVSSVTALPVRYFGQNTANPPSEGSINADLDRLINRGARKQRSFGGSWELVQRLARRVRDGEWDPSLQMMETMWADLGTPTRAQTADAVTKLVGATIDGVPVLPMEMAREELGWSATRRARARILDQEFLDGAAAAQANDPINPTIAALSKNLIDSGAA